MNPIVISPPVSGRWKTLRPPGHHPHAYDFVQVDDRYIATHRQNPLREIFGGIPSSSYYCWNQPVLAPIDGKVIQVGNGWRDRLSAGIWKTIRIWYDATYGFRPKMQNGRLDIRPNAGNHVMIQSHAGFIVFLAHLRNESVTLTEGSEIRKGDTVGRVGNSGNSTAPHLHLNVFDQMEDPYAARVLPFVFDYYEVLERGTSVACRSSIPEPGSILRFPEAR